MEYFSIVYRILKSVYESMDCDEFDAESISPDVLGISIAKWEKIMLELIHNGYISGITIEPRAYTPRMKVIYTRPAVTIKGAEYLESNTMMRKVQRATKGIKDAIPGA